MSTQKKQIVQTALEILNRDGLEGVTLRRLAKELDIKAASIYWHILNKERLLDEMAYAILDEHFGTFEFENDQRDWTEWLDTLAHELRAAMLAYKDGARVVAGAHPDIAVILVKLWDFTARVLQNGGFSLVKSVAITVTMINFTFGSVIEEQASPPYDTAPEDAESAIQSIASQLQMFTQAMEILQDDTSSVIFKTGVRIIIDGARAELNRENGNKNVS